MKMPEVIREVEVPKIIERKVWNSMMVRETCIRFNLYKGGTVKEYENMLFNMVEKMPPTAENIFVVADDICKHSDNHCITNVMFILANNAVKTFYDMK
jgi:hypothetical protein